MRAARPLKIFFDGGCRPNPGRMEVAAVARGRLHHLPDLGFGSSAEAEWRALLHALDVAASLDARDVLLVGDAANVIAQAFRRARCGASARPFRDEFEKRRESFARVRVRHVRRGLNLAGIALGRVAGR